MSAVPYVQAPVPAAAPTARLVVTFNLPGVSYPLNQSAAVALLTAVNSTLANSSVAATISLGSAVVRTFPQDLLPLDLLHNACSRMSEKSAPL